MNQKEEEIEYIVQLKFITNKEFIKKQKQTNKQTKNYKKIKGNQTTPMKYFGNYVNILLYAIITCLVVIPVTISFTYVIFQDEIYQQHISILSKLLLFSSLIHMIIINLNSSLPYAIGQVQDAGIVFLASMVKIITSHFKETNSSIETQLSTVCVLLSLATSTLGLIILFISRLRVIRPLMNYFHLAVCGGYLAYIGFFCGQAGIAYMANITIDNIYDWDQLFQFPSSVCLTDNFIGENYPLSCHSIILIIPGLALSLSIYFTSKYISKSALVTPFFIFCFVLIFYLILYIRQISIDEANKYGWLAGSNNLTEIAPERAFHNTTNNDNGYKNNITNDSIKYTMTENFSSSSIFEKKLNLSYVFHTLLNVTIVEYHFIFFIIRPWILLCLVVLVSSSLDLLAIETELKERSKNEKSISAEDTEQRRTFDGNTDRASFVCDDEDDYVHIEILFIENNTQTAAKGRAEIEDGEEKDTKNYSRPSHGLTEVSKCQNKCDKKKEDETVRKLDYDYELMIIGISNIVSGLSGGYSGSYIFSQTIFLMRNGVQSRMCGILIILIQLLFVLFPLDKCFKYIPKFVFGGILLLIAIDLIIEWLFSRAWKTPKLEFSFSWIVFIIFIFMGVEIGILASFLISLLIFGIERYKTQEKNRK